MNEVKRREEIDDKYKWDLTYLYKSDEEWYKTLSIVQQQAEKIKDFLNIKFTRSQELSSYLKYHDDTLQIINTLYLYAISKYDENRNNDKYVQMYETILNVSDEFNNYSDLIDNNICRLSSKKINEHLKNDNSLQEYKIYLKNLFRLKKHMLNSSQKKVISKLNNCFAFEDIAADLRFLDMEFGTIKDEEGNDVELTRNNYLLYRSSNNREIRKNAFEETYKSYEKHKNTFSSTFIAYIAYETALAKMRKFDSVLEASLFDSNIDVSIYEKLIKTVNKNFGTIHKIYDLKKEILNLEELHLYDIYTNFNVESKKSYTYEEALEIIFKVLKPLGKEYLDKLKDYISTRKIDVYENAGKYGHDYCRYINGYDPVILLNYESTIRGVEVLIHELGHAMHTCFSNANNSYKYQGQTEFVAEVASTTNEFLLWNYILDNSNDIEEKLYVLNHILNEFQDILIRQTMFAEFEKKVYELYDDQVLTTSILCDTYYDLNKKYFGDDVIVDDLIKYEWMKVPHFYWNFYCYVYATGLASSCQIATNILNKDENAVENYLKFLKSGKSDTPVNELKMAGVDVTNNEYINNAMKYLDNTITQLKENYSEYQKIKKIN